MLVPKRHITRIEEVRVEEFQELQDLTHYALEMYSEAGLMHDPETPVQNYVFFWRFRQSGEANRFAHLHVHLAPDKDRFWDPILDNSAHLADISLLREGRYVPHQN